MDSTPKEEELTQWFSTYGVITAERILSKYQLELSQEQLPEAITNTSSVYHQLIQVPLKNVLNGIILQQAEDYHVYAQKLVIDYLLSASGAAPEDASGSSSREQLEEERTKLIALGESFSQLRLEQDVLIASSQAHLIKSTTRWRVAFEKALQSIKAVLNQTGQSIKPSVIRKAINQVLIQGEPRIDVLNNTLLCVLEKGMNENLMACLDELMTVSRDFNPSSSDYFNQTKVLNEGARWYRMQFYEAILRITNLLKILPDYKINESRDQVNRELLYFDKTIGEKAI